MTAYRLAMVLALGLTLGCQRGGSGSISGGLSDDGTSDNANVRLAMSATGYGFAVWELTNGAGTHLAVNSYVPLAGWGGVEFPATGAGARDPDVAMSRYSQDARFVWAEQDGRQGTIASVRWDGEQNQWDAVETIVTYADGVVFDPRLGVDGSGQAAVVWTFKWYEGTTPHFGVFASRLERGEEASRWTEPEQIDDAAHDDMDAFDPEIAMNDDGFAIVTMLYTPRDQNRFRVQAALLQPSFDGGPPTWSEPIAIGTTQDTVVNGTHRVTVNAEGQGAVVWQETVADDRVAYVNFFAPGEGFIGHQRLRTDRTHESFAPAVGNDAYGSTFLVTWAESSDGGPATLLARRYTSGDWLAVETIATDVMDAQELRVAMDESGSATAMWIAADGDVTSLSSSRFTVEQGWSLPLAVETDAATVSNPSLASDFAGHCLATWVRTLDGQVDVWANDYDPAQGWGGASSR